MFRSIAALLGIRRASPIVPSITLEIDREANDRARQAQVIFAQKWQAQGGYYPMAIRALKEAPPGEAKVKEHARHMWSIHPDLRNGFFAKPVAGNNTINRRGFMHLDVINYSEYVKVSDRKDELEAELKKLTAELERVKICHAMDDLFKLKTMKAELSDDRKDT